MNKMQGLNLELTTCCPLHCPQCYCTLEGGRHLDFDIAKEKLKEAGEHGVQIVHLSGGETMCYPQIVELVAYAAAHIPHVHVALSGYHFDEQVLDNLVAAGVTGIFISLNGSTEEINELTRDGYALALHALEVLKNRQYPNTYLNWVMHSNNCSDFENVLKLAEDYQVSNVIVLAFKPDSRHEMNSFPSGEQIKKIADVIRGYRGSVKIGVESCFSQLLAVVKDTVLFGNLNVGPMKGCRAGLYNYSINIDGQYSPCRHLDYPEAFDTLDEYLEQSQIISKIRAADQAIREPCSECRYKMNCRPCLAVNSKMNGDIYIGHEICSVWSAE